MKLFYLNLKIILIVFLLIGSIIDSKKNYYQILNLKPNALDSEIKRQYHELSLKYHPDKNPNSNANEKFTEISQAYGILKDPVSRKVYDEDEKDFIELSSSPFYFIYEIYYNLIDNINYIKMKLNVNFNINEKFVTIIIGLLFVLFYFLYSKIVKTYKDYQLKQELKKFQQIIIDENKGHNTKTKEDKNDTEVSMNIKSESKAEFVLEISLKDDNSNHQHYFETKAINSTMDLLNYVQRPYISLLVEQRGDFSPCRANASSSLQQRSQLLVCHDMKGNYLDCDRYHTGGTFVDPFMLLHWHVIDIFCYFSHQLVSIPPLSWINVCRRHGRAIIGTFITEWDEGKAICNELFATKESTEKVATQLAQIAEDYVIDGWLINIENTLDSNILIENMQYFLIKLREKMEYVSIERARAKSTPVCRTHVIWYDSVTIKGELKWQDELNHLNETFFKCCDGIFLNYHWKVDKPYNTVARAGQRRYDCYFGCDVWGRGTFGGGGYDSDCAGIVVRRAGASLALFAPGWILEHELGNSIPRSTAAIAHVNKYLQELFCKTNQLWDRLSISLTGKKHMYGSEKSPTPLDICCAGFGGGSCKLPIVVKFSLPVGTSGVHIDGNSHMHLAETKEDAFFDLNMQDVNHWMPTILGKFYKSSKSKVGACSGLGIAPDHSDYHTMDAGITVSYNSSNGFEGAGCLCMTGLMPYKSHTSVRISSYRSTVDHSINAWTCFQRPVFPKQATPVIVRMSVVVSKGVDVALRLLFATQAGSSNSALLLRGNGGNMNDDNKNQNQNNNSLFTLYPSFMMESGCVRFPKIEKSKVAYENRSWEVREYIISQDTVTALSSRQVIGMELVCISKNNTDPKNEKEDELRPIRAYIGHIVLGAKVQLKHLHGDINKKNKGEIPPSLQELVINRTKFKAQFLIAQQCINDDISSSNSNSNHKIQALFDWSCLTMKLVDYQKSMRFPKTEEIDIGSIMIFAKRQKQKERKEKSWCLIGRGVNGEYGTIILNIPHECISADAKEIVLNLVPRTVCLVSPLISSSDGDGTTTINNFNGLEITCSIKY